MSPAGLTEPVVIVAAEVDAVIFDMDGVVTDTTGAHQAAWKHVFDDFLTRHVGPDAAPFDRSIDYLKYVDGKPRYDGVRSFLASRGITVAAGSPSDPPGADTVHGIGNRKNDEFLAHIAAYGAAAYPSTLHLIDRLHRAGVRTGLITSSQNARTVLDAADVPDVFDVIVDGKVAVQRGLAGKPSPAVFLAAIDAMGVDPERAVVVEDAISGVVAGRTGGFGLVIGVARGDNVARLRAAGADVVVTDLAAVSVEV